MLKNNFVLQDVYLVPSNIYLEKIHTKINKT